jgi:hypothetical protein
MSEKQIIEWLLKGDVAIQYQVYRDLLGTERKGLQQKIESEGWGKQFLSRRLSIGHWGERFYQPKWTSTHYTLLDLRNLNLDPDNKIVKETIEMVLGNGKAEDGGIPLGPSTSRYSDICVNGMFLNYASYFHIPEEKLSSIADSILNEIMPDGGFNCRTTRSGAKHSSLHTTISVLEGFYEFLKSGYTYRIKEITRAKESAEEFILQHRLFLSDRTGDVINKGFLKMPYPCRWKYDILRALDYFQYAGSNWDERMKSAVGILMERRNSNGTWNIQAAHQGAVHFIMEEAGRAGRWNTLRAMRVLKQFDVA